MEFFAPLSLKESGWEFEGKALKVLRFFLFRVDLCFGMWYIYHVKIKIYHMPKGGTCFMKQKINYLGLLSLLALIAVLGWRTGNRGLYGFFGFAYYLRYFWVFPDEFFRLNVQRAATAAFMTEMLSLVPLLFACTYLFGGRKGVPPAFGLSFAAGVFLFTAMLLFLEWKEQRGAEND